LKRGGDGGATELCVPAPSACRTRLPRPSPAVIPGCTASQTYNSGWAAGLRAP